MKKSFIMTVAVSMALSAVATETGYISGTSFEDISLGEKSSVELVKNANDLGVVNNVCYWSTDAWKTENSADYEGFFVVTNIPDNASYQGSRPEYWATSTKKNALVIDTDKPLYRRINPVISMDNSTERTLDTKGVFFDSVVQFTATDVPLEPGNSDKLLVWLYTSPEDVATNPGLFDETTPKTTLVVTAGYYKENDNTLYTTNYCVAADNVSIKPDEWHRLTIKAFISNDGMHALFNVYVDGNKVKKEDEKSDFISLKDGLTSIPDIIGVAFDGKGMVDDIAFTTKDPFAQSEAQKFTIAFVEDDQFFAIIDKAYSVDNGSSVQFTEGSIDIPVSSQKVKFAITLAAGYTITATCGNTDLSVTKDSGVCSFEIDVASTEADAELSVSCTVVADTGSDDKPTIGGVGYDGNSLVEVAKSGAQITVPSDDWSVEGNVLKDAKDDDFATFAAYYVLTKDGTTVTVALDQKAAAPFAEATDLDDGEEVLEVGEDASGNPELTVRIKPYVGLYYGAMTGTALDNMTLTFDYQQATSTDVIEFTATGKAGDTASFIKVVVTDIAPEATEK